MTESTKYLDVNFKYLYQKNYSRYYDPSVGDPSVSDNWGKKHVGFNVYIPGSLRIIAGIEWRVVSRMPLYELVAQMWVDGKAILDPSLERPNHILIDKVPNENLEWDVTKHPLPMWPEWAFKTGVHKLAIIPGLRINSYRPPKERAIYKEPMWFDENYIEYEIELFDYVRKTPGQGVVDDMLRIFKRD